MRKPNLVDFAVSAAVTLLAATPALAGDGPPPVPAPVMGAGIAALAVMGVGYLVIRRRGR